MAQELVVANIEGMDEVEHAVFEIALELDGGDTTRLRLSRSVLRQLAELVNVNLNY